jgi:ATP-dependent DNA helicase HFM1/MER3
MRCATVKPKIAPSMFTVSKLMEREPLHQSNTSKRRTESLEVQRNQLHPRDDYGDNEIDDNELLNMPLGDLDFDDIDNFSSIADITTRNGALNNDANKKRDIARPVDTFLDDDHEPGPVQLDNGKWACNHRCKDKTACKHMCCREGVEKPPKKVPKKASNDKSASQSTSQISGQKDKKLQTKLQLTTTKRKNSELVEQLDLTQPEKKSKSGSVSKNPEYRRLEHLHQSVQKNKLTPSTSNIFPKRPEKVYDESGRGLSFLHPSATQRHETSSDYGDMHIDEFPPEPPNYGNELSYADYIPDSTSAMAMDYSTKVPVASQQSDTFDDDSLLGDAMIGLADSQHLASMPAFNDSGVRFSEEPTGIDYDYEADIHDDDFPMSINSADLNDIGPNKAGHLESTSYNPPHDVSKYPSEAQPELAHFQPEKAISDPSELGKPRGIEPEGASSLTTNRREISDKSWDFDASIFDILSQPDEVQDNAKLDGSTGDNVKLDCEASDLSKQHDISSSAVKKEEIADDFKGLQPWLFEEFGDIVEIDDD